MKSLTNRKRRRTPIGLDVGESGVRAAQLLRSGTQYTVEGLTQAEWQQDALAGASVRHLLAARVESCLRMGTFRGSEVVAALDPPSVEFHALELPSKIFSDEGAEVSDVVRWELGRLMNEPVEDVETRYWQLPPPQGAAPNAVGVSARHDAVAEHMNVYKDAGLVCSRLDTGASALSRFGVLLNAWSEDDVWGVLDIGFRDARLALCVGDVPVLVRRAGTGGRDWTERIAESLQLGARAAEVHKCDHGIALTARGVRRAADEPPSAELGAILLGALRGELKELASEIKRSYEYVLSCYPKRRAADLILVGGGAATRHLPEYLHDLLGIAVHRASEYLQRDSCRLRYASGKQNRIESLALAIGLAVDGN